MNLYERNFIISRDNCFGHANVYRLAGPFSPLFSPFVSKADPRDLFLPSRAIGSVTIGSWLRSVFDRGSVERRRSEESYVESYVESREAIYR